MVNVRQANSKLDYLGIKKLQEINLPTELSQDEITSQGFVTCSYSIEDLATMNQSYPHIVAEYQSSIVGYCLVMLKNQRDITPILNPMFDHIDRAEIQGIRLSELNYFVMGQVCIAKEWRSKKLFYCMYDLLRETMRSDFEMVVTEISQHNSRSLRAHQKHGFKPLLDYISPDGHPWSIVYWDWRDSVVLS